MFYSIKSRLVASFIGVSFFVGAVSLLVGGDLLNESVLGEAKNRVGLDLNAANEVYRNRIKQVEVSLNITTLGYGFILALKNRPLSTRRKSSGCWSGQQPMGNSSTSCSTIGQMPLRSMI